MGYWNSKLKTSFNWRDEHPEDYYPHTEPAYHVAPASARESILAHGLDYSKHQGEGPWGEEDSPHANYIHHSLDGARHRQQWMQGWAGPHDVWQIDPTGKEIEAVQDGAPEMGSMGAIYAPIEPSYLSLVQ